MKLTMNVSEDRQLFIPSDVIETMDLQPGSVVEVEITDNMPHLFDQAKWDAAMIEIEKMRAALSKQMLEDGYASVDQLMADLRPGW